MNKIFCVSCGFKNIYEATKPRFCAKCGSAIDGVKIVAQASDDQEDEIGISLSKIDFAKLRKSISVELPRKEKIEDVIGTAEANERPLKRRTSDLPDGMALFKQNEKDCAPVKASKDIDE